VPSRPIPKPSFPLFADIFWFKLPA